MRGWSSGLVDRKPWETQEEEDEPDLEGAIDRFERYGQRPIR